MVALEKETEEIPEEQEIQTLRKRFVPKLLSSITVHVGDTFRGLSILTQKEFENRYPLERRIRH